MVAAGNDPNIAMTLIGMCGHDNTGQGPGNGIRCPPLGSQMYFPQSLGAGIDIPQELKDRILALQSSPSDPNPPQSKYYHVLGAAATSCLLIQRGVPRIVAQTIVQTAANAYRIGRLCSEIQTTQSKPIQPEGQSEEQIAQLDAIFTLSNFSTIRNDCRTSGTSATLFRILSQKQYESVTSPPCPHGINRSRCSRMRRRIATWEIDREWTVTQHMLGFEFAARSCRPTVTTQKGLEEAACRLVQDLETPPSEPVAR